MRPFSYWFWQYVLAATSMFAVLVAVGLLRGETFAATSSGSLPWAIASAAIFTGSQYWRWRKGAACALCEAVKKD